MKKFLWFSLVALLAFAVAFAFNQQAQAQASEVPHHWHIKAIQRTPNNEGVRSEATGAAPAAGLYGIGQAFVETPQNQPGNSANAELWPCFGGDPSGQPDCAYIGSTGTSDSPSIAGSAVLGTPAFVWYLSVDTTDAPEQPFGCDASTTADATNYCGQTNTWYEDWSGDSVDELTYLIEATQDGSVVSDSGTVDFGPNSFGAAEPVADVIIYGDSNFGTVGATGKNNGNCLANVNYPIAGANFAPISSIAESGTTATATLTSASDAVIGVGDEWYITGTSNSNYNGTVALVTAVTATTFKWTAAASGLGSATGGQAILDLNAAQTASAYPVITSANKTCVDPVASSSISKAATDQEVKLSATTAVESAAYTKETSATTCAPAGGAPCYEVKYTSKYKLSQSWYIWMR